MLIYLDLNFYMQIKVICIRPISPNTVKDFESTHLTQCQKKQIKGTCSQLKINTCIKTLYNFISYNLIVVPIIKLAGSTRNVFSTFKRSVNHNID